MTVQEFASRLEGVRWSGDRATARCPAHTDRTPSLSISAGTGDRVVVHCHAGCSAENIVAAIGLKLAELGPSNRHGTTGPGNVIAAYSYRDEAGTVLYEVVRFDPKGFRQRRPDGSGGWVWNLERVRRVLYRLPELLAADPNDVVYIVEGEKDADALAKLGLVATTNAGGAGKWRKEYAEFLRSRTVAILPDNDEPGRAHARNVADSLIRVGCVVKIVELPDLKPKGDVSEFLGKGGTVGELVELVNSVSEYLREESAGHVDEGPTQNSISYEATGGGMVWHKRTDHGPVAIPLTNFTARIVADVLHDDGVEPQRTLELEATLAGSTSTFRVVASQFDSLRWVMPNLGARAVVYPGFSAKDHTKVAIQLLSPTPTQKVVYTHTGWREIDSAWKFLHAAGAIGPDGLDENVTVELNSALEGFRLPPPPAGDELIDAVRGSLRILELGRPEAIFPVYAAIWRAVLGTCDFGVHLVGATGVFKSELAALAQQHFGTSFDARHLPGAWSSTDNALEMAASLAKDALFVVDDFAPEGARADVDRLHARAARLYRAQGNNSGRQRLSRDAALRPSRPPRGLILGTGEDIPRGQSVRARLCIVEVAKDDVAPEALTVCQSDAASGHYVAAMSGFLSWLALGYETVRSSFHADIAELRPQLEGVGQHRRTPEIAAQLALGFRYFLNFAEDIGAVGSEEAATLWDRGVAALRDASASQSQHQRSSDPVSRYLELLASALAAGDAHLDAPDGSAPKDPGRYGWRLSLAESDGHERREWKAQGKCIGWVDGPDLFLEPAGSYRAVRQLGGDNSDSLTVSERTLRKRLHERGLLRTTELESGRNTYTVRRQLDGSRKEVLHLHTGRVLPAEVDLVDQPDPPSRNSTKNSHLGAPEWSGLMRRDGPTRPLDPTTGHEPEGNGGLLYPNRSEDDAR